LPPGVIASPGLRYDWHMNKTVTAWVAASALLALSACGSGGEQSSASASSAASHGAEEKLSELTPEEVDARIAKNDGSFFVYDNNGKDVFDKEHLPTAKWVAFDKVTAADLPANKDATLVFYCMNTH
jgi:ABC-type enterochelin transport system substrate-binding protein